MAIRSRGGAVTPAKPKAAAKPAAKSPAKASANVSESDEVDTDGVTTVNVSRSYTIPGAAEYESMKIGVSVSAPTYEQASVAVENFMSLEFEKASAQFAELAASAEGVERAISEPDEEDAEEGEADDDAGGEGEEETLTPEDISTMARADLVELIETNELDIDPDDFAGKSGLVKLREEVTGLLFADEEAEDEAEDEAEADDDGEESLTEADIMAMKRSELVALIEANELDIDPDDHKKLTALQAAVIEALNEDEDGEDADAEEGEAEDGEDDTGYTCDELEKMSLDDLKEIWDSWSIKGKFPTGTPIVKKKAAITAILKTQETGA